MEERTSEKKTDRPTWKTRAIYLCLSAEPLVQKYEQDNRESSHILGKPSQQQKNQDKQKTQN